MTTWWWIRHGPTHEKNFVGWRDVPADLSDTAQIARLNAYLPSDALLVSSDLIRASATADVLDQTRTRLPHAPDMREFNFGDWDGLGFAAVTQRDPDLSRAYWEKPGDITPPNGESWNSAAARLKPFVDGINAKHPDRHIIAVAHIGIILTQLQRASGQTPVQTIAQKIDNLSVTKLQWKTGGRETRALKTGQWHVDTINHLP